MANQSELSETVPIQAPVNPYAIQAADAQRKKAIADLLLRSSQSGAPQGQMVSGHYIAPALSQQLLPVIQALRSRSLNSQANVSQQNLAQQYMQGQGAALQDFMKQMQGGDRFGAIVKALSSPYTGLQQAGQKMLSTMPSGKDLGDLASKFTPDSVTKFQSSNNPSDLVPVTQIKAGEGAQQVIGVGPNAQVSTPQQGQAFTPPQMGPGGVPMQVNSITGQAQFGHPKEFTSVNVAQMPENKLLGTAGELSYEGLQKSKEQALAAQESITGLQSARQILTNGNIWQNYGAEWIPTVKSALAQLGQPLSKADEAKLGNSNAAQQVLLNATMKAALASESARGMNTKAEQAAIQASAADENATLPSRLGALDAAIAGQANVINQHHQQVQQITAVPQGMDPAVASQLAAPNALVRQAMDVSPVELDPTRYTKQPSGLYMTNALTPQGPIPGASAAPGQPTSAPAPAGPQAPPGLNLPAGFSYVGPAPQ